jgi:hypothetical protein
MILLFLGNWRLTLIILATIPLSIITAILVMYVGGQTLNTMTLGGFALAVGILVDNGTVVIENIERHVGRAKPLSQAIIDGAARSRSHRAVDALHLHRVRAGLPAAGHGQISVLAAVAVGLRLADRQPGAVLHAGAGAVQIPDALASRACVPSPAAAPKRPLAVQSFSARSITASRPASTVCARVIATASPLRGAPLPTSRFLLRADDGARCCCSRSSAATSSRRSTPARCGCMSARRPPADRGDPALFRRSRTRDPQIVGEDQIDVILDNIGLPYSGINIALSDSATVGPMDGEILVSLKEEAHARPPSIVADLRRELPKRFPELQFFFQPADIVDQVLNFGQPAPIDIRISGPRQATRPSRWLRRSPATSRPFPASSIPMCSRFRTRPPLDIDVDRTLAAARRSPGEAANNVLVTTNWQRADRAQFLGRSQTASAIRWSCRCRPIASIRPRIWDPADHVRAAAGVEKAQMLMNVANSGASTTPLVMSQLNIRPVFDVNADVQGRDLAPPRGDIDKVRRATGPMPSSHHDHAQRPGRNHARKL